MPFATAPLLPHVRAILDAASDEDLQVISGKRVRRELLARAPELLSPADVKEHKDVLDALIADVFAEVSRARFGAPDDENGGAGGDDASEGADGTPATDGADEDEAAEEDEEEEEAKPAKKKQKRARGELSDEQLARRLASELNGSTRSTRTGAATKRGGRGGGRGGKRGAKSAARVEESDDDSEGGGKKRKRKSGGGGGGGGAKGGFGKEYALSSELAAVVGAEKMSRPQVVKQLWAHIKAHELQNPENKKQIVCDDALRSLFNTDKIDMFQMNKVLGQHLHQAE